jgi:glycosyltransferase involved in cell wall biosynthesis
MLTRPWHVVHVIGSLRVGGAERQLLNYLGAADREDFRHTVLCLREPGPLAPAAAEMGIGVQVLRPRTRYAPWSVWSLARWLREQDVAVLHTHMHQPSLWGRLAGLMAGTPVMLTTEHGREAWKGPLRVAVDRLLSRVTSRHIAVSAEGRQTRIRRERIDPRRIVLIPNGIPLPSRPNDPAVAARIRREFGVAAEAPLLGSVGRVVAEKGYEDMLAALSGLVTTHPGIRWLVVGEGDRQTELERIARRSGLGEVVIWAGQRDDVTEILHALDLWVMCSVSEGLPVALLEAMAARLPIVATRVGGIPDAVADHEEARLVSPGVPDDLAQAIVGLLDDRAEASKLAEAARARAKRDYGIVGVAARIEALYREELVRSGVAGDADGA